MEIAPPAHLTRRLGLLALALACLAAFTGCGKALDGEATAAGEVVLTPEAAADGREELREVAPARESQARLVELRGAGATPEPASADPAEDAPSPGAPSDAEVRAELRAARASLTRFRRFLDTTAYLPTGPRARVLPDGTAVAPEAAPEPVKRVILAANQIAKFPCKWGGGHGAWRDNGYDCSGSVSFALAGAGLLDRPLTSGLLAGYGRAGEGRWITIYANGGHVFMVVAGLRFDTSGQGRAGTRWQTETRSTAGFAARHVPGL